MEGAGRREEEDEEKGEEQLEVEDSGLPGCAARRCLREGEREIDYWLEPGQARIFVIVVAISIIRMVASGN